jgi:hypothetical protein
MRLVKQPTLIPAAPNPFTLRSALGLRSNDAAYGIAAVSDAALRSRGRTTTRRRVAQADGPVTTVSPW